jgi:hypothetical protein
MAMAIKAQGKMLHGATKPHKLSEITTTLIRYLIIFNFFLIVQLQNCFFILEEYITEQPIFYLKH